MATFDDRHWLLSHIENSYITSDDTGFCEMVLQGEVASSVLSDIPGKAYPQSPSPTGNEDPPPHSLDVASDLDFGGSRQRSNTAQRLEKMKKERRSTTRIKKIHWKPPSSQISDEELEDMFATKTIFPPSPVKSLLTQKLEEMPEDLCNPFLKYAKFDGITHNNVATQNISIFLILGEDLTPSLYPLHVCVVSSAKVSDLIGLTCWLYTKENRQPTLKEEVERYSLHIAEDDGQVDWEFQMLPPNDTINKFGFKTLALAERRNYSDSSEGFVVTVNISGGVFSKIEVESQEITLREILSRTVARRREMARIIDAGVDYHLEREDEPGVILCLDKTLGQVHCSEFAAVRDNSKRVRNESEEPDLEPCQVVWVRTLAKCEATIDIKHHEIKIQVMQQRSRRKNILASQLQTGLVYNINKLIGCSRKPVKKGKYELQLSFRGENSFKDHLFECDSATSKILLEKCQKIVELNQISARDKKQQQRRHSSLSMRRRPRPGNHSV